MKNKITSLLMVTVSTLCMSEYAIAETAMSSQQRSMRSLDEQVQEIKTDVLDIASELAMLEERLLYPSNTQVSVFVSVTGAEKGRLDAVRLSINGEPATHYIYSFKELEALQLGGVQRLYTGNLSRGDHQMEITVMGKLPSGDEFTRTRDFSFSKEIQPQLLGLTVADLQSGSPSIELSEW